MSSEVARVRRLPRVGGMILGQLNLMIWLSFALLVATSIFVFRTPFGLRLRSVGEHPRAAETVRISVYRVRYLAVIGSGAIAAVAGVVGRSIGPAATGSPYAKQ